MTKIKLLDSKLTNMIAAGEVVERPMGIVKELIENSIDANSKNIIVKVEQGGIKSIQVIDDGYGMDSEDIVLAFKRHATSKIFKTNDLWNINTFGFRGEALPSIASVSNVVFLSNNQSESNRIEIEYGETISVAPYPCNEGSDITVSNLFFKTPARLKHLKNASYENALVNDIIIKFALANPSISFTFISDNKEVFKSSGNGDLLEVIFKVYGKDIAKSAIKVEEEDFDYKLNGYIIQPQYTKANKNAVSIFINNRIVKPYKIQKAIIDSYLEYIPNDRYPIAVINISMDSHLLDVNVHPSKWEVRLSKQQQLEFFIKDKIEHLLKKDITPFVITKSLTQKPVIDNTKYEAISMDNDFVYKQSYIEDSKSDEATFIKEEHIEESESVNIKPNTLGDLRVIGQFHGKFILAEGFKGLYVIDQHAAQERVHFEEISKMLENSKGLFELLIPVSINCSNDIVNRIDLLNEFVLDLNIHFEPFGNDSLIVHSLPLWLKDIDFKTFLIDLVDYFKEGKTIDNINIRRRKIATMACKSSIRFNKILDLKQMQQVIDELNKCEQPFQCPHGRPTFVLIEDYYLEREFLR